MKTPSSRRPVITAATLLILSPVAVFANSGADTAPSAGGDVIVQTAQQSAETTSAAAVQPVPARAAEPAGVPASQPAIPGGFDGFAADPIAAGQDYHNRLTVPVTIGGEGPFQFMVDTGSQATAVSHETSARLSLPPAGRATVVGMASREVVDLVELDGLSLADRTFDGIDAPVLASRHMGADGMIGLDSLQDLRVLLDFRDDTISVSETQRTSGFEIVIKARRQDNQLIITDALIDGVRTAIIIDTGAQQSIGNLALLNKLRSRQRGEVTMTDVHGGSLSGNYAVSRRLKFDELELTNVVVTYADTPAFEVLGYTDRPVLSLGMDHLRMFDRVAIDFERRRVMFDLPSGTRAARRAW